MVDTIVADEEALSKLADHFQAYSTELHNAYQEVLRSITDLQENWDDEDHDALLEAIQSFKVEMQNMINNSMLLKDRALQKLEAIHELHKLTI